MKLLGHHDHRSHLFGAGDADPWRGGAAGAGALTGDITRRTSVELIDPLTSLAQLLALLLDQFFELVDLAREAFEKSSTSSTLYPRTPILRPPYQWRPTLSRRNRCYPCSNPTALIVTNR